MSHIESTTVELLNGTLTLIELCTYTQLPQHDVVAMVEIGLLEPINMAVVSDEYQFVPGDLRRIRVAKRLMRDLGVNLESVAMIVDLLEEREALLKRINMLERLSER
jgi:chaperone modulatory protein CbpM